MKRPLAAALALLGLAACPHRPLSFGRRGEITDVSGAVAALSSRSEKLETLQAEASVSGKSEKGSASTGGLIAAARPASLKLELDDFFGNPAAVLTTNGTLLGIYTAQDGIYGEGEASARNLTKLVPIELPLGEAVDLLFGDPRPLGAPLSFAVDREMRSYALQFVDGDRKQRIDLDTETLAPVRVRVEGRSPYEARFSDPEHGSGLLLPTKVEIEAPTGRVSVGYRRLEVNPTLASELFQPTAPAGAKRMRFGD